MRAECRTPASGKGGGRKRIEDNAGALKDKSPRHQRQAQPAGGFTTINEVAADIVADLRFRRQVKTLCTRPRAMAELLAGLGARFGIRTTIDLLLAEYLRFDDAVLEAVGAGDFPPVPIHRVQK